MEKTLGLILAGGQATRMNGQDKAFVSLGGVSLLDRVLRRLEPQVDQVAVNSNAVDRLAHLDIPVLPDVFAGFAGPLAGVLTGMDWAFEKGVDHLITVAVDTPFFPQDLVARLWAGAAGMEHPFAIASTSGRHPTFGLWPVALRHDLRAALEAGTRKVSLWADLHGARSVAFPDTPFDPFFNINAPEDLAQAERLVAS